MKTISSRTTFFYKRIFPVVWLGMVASGLVIGAVATVASQKAVSPAVFVGPVIMLVVGVLLFRKLAWELADEVQDAGDSLLVRKGSEELRIPLADIMNVSSNPMGRPPRLSLRLRKPGKFGDEIAFIPASPGIRFNPFARNEIAEDLIKRVDRARQESR